MKTRHNTMRWLGLALTSSIIAFAGSVEAKKGGGGGGGKPPPKPPPAAAYDLVLLGNPGSSSSAIDVNESGLVVGSVSYYFPDGYSYNHATLVVPEVDAGSLVWRKDSDSDGHNDLLVDLGAPVFAPDSAGPCNINDHGVILGGASHLVPDQAPNNFAWILAPQVVEGQSTWTDLDTNGVNSLIMPLPVVSDLEDPYLQALPQHINNYGEVAVVVECYDPANRWQRGFLLTPSRYEISVDGGVTIEYPQADLDGDGLNDYLIDLGSGVRIKDGSSHPLNGIMINDRGDVAGKVWNDWLGEVNGERPFVLRPQEDENGGLIWNEDSDTNGLNDLVVYLPLPDEVIAEAPHWSDVSSISDMNENGAILGGVFYGAPKGKRGAIWQVDWDAGTVSYTELQVLNSRYDATLPHAINATGQVVGRSIRYTHNEAYQKGWLWDQGVMSALDDLVPGLAEVYNVALGINDSGMIVGAQQMVYGGKWTAFIAVPVEQP